MAELVKLTVDGKEIEAPKGGLLIDTFYKEDIEIPHFCYHEALGREGNCRMCMVEIEGSKRPQIACDTPIKEGMVIRTKGEKIEKVRKDILELELINHPIDCPTCDQAGECKLQDYYMEGGLYDNRVNTQKTHGKKAVELGREVMLDQERCVTCTRCVRFFRDFVGTKELGVEHRTDHSVITTFPGMKLQSVYSMNIVDMCPVGALTSKDFRFNQRVWFLESFESICAGCSKGCNIRVDHRKEKYKDDQIFRFKPVKNMDVNGHFICDDGRLSYKKENENRFITPKLNGNDVEVQRAKNEAISLLKENKGKTLFVVSPNLSVEELEFVNSLANGTSNTISGYAPQYFDESFADDKLRTNDKSANRAAYAKVGINEDKEDFENKLNSASTVVVLDNSYFEENSDALAGKKVISCFSNNNNIIEKSDVALPIASFYEKNGSYINCDGITQEVVSGMVKNNPIDCLVTLFEDIKSQI